MIKRLTLFLLIVCGSIAMGQTGIISTVAGCNKEGFSGDGGPAIFAELYWPANIAFDKYDNMFIADQNNNRIRAVNAATGNIYTVVGAATPGYNGDSIPALGAKLNFPASMTVDTFGNIFIADFSNNRVREVVNATGFIYTVAGNGILGYTGDGGPATAAEVNHPHHTAVDNKGNLFFADEYNNRIRKVVLSTGIITTVAGGAGQGFGGDGGQATSAMLNSPKCVALDKKGNMYIADWSNARIRRVDAATGIITTVAGNGSPGYCCDGVPATSTPLNYPFRVAVDSADNFYIADGSDNRIRWVNGSTGIINTLAGNGEIGYCCDGGPATDAELNYPPGLALNNEGNLFIADIKNNRVREVVLNASSGVAAIADSPGVSVYPNPAYTETTVYFTNTNNAATLSLFNLTGQMVLQTTKSSYINQVNIPLNGFSPGVYLLQIQMPGKSAIWKRLDIVR